MNEQDFYEDIPKEYCMSKDEMIEFELEFGLDRINSEIQIAADLDKQDREIS
jgi:hypothetical protein